MEEIQNQIAAAEAALGEVKQKPGTTGPRQIAALEAILNALKGIAAGLDALTKAAPSA